MEHRATIDIGTHSTRLLVCAIESDGSLREVEPRSEVTRLGEGVDLVGVLNESAIQRTLARVTEYVEIVDRYKIKPRALMTSAVRDSKNSKLFAKCVSELIGSEAEVLSGQQEAELTFRGASSALNSDEVIWVIDIGGGSTEMILGSRGKIDFFCSLNAGVIRFSERYLKSDPPTANEISTLKAALKEITTATVSNPPPATPVIAVAGTATSCAAINLKLDPYDHDRVEGYVISLDKLRDIGELLAGLSLAERRNVIGLHPDRAAAIVAGVETLIVLLECLGQDHVTVSERDLLLGSMIC